MPGADNLIVEARAALLDAAAALEAHANSVILIGAQAIYLHTGSATFALGRRRASSSTPSANSPEPGSRPTGHLSTSWSRSTLLAPSAVAVSASHPTASTLHVERLALRQPSSTGRP